MDWQLLVVGVLVVLAALYLGRAAYCTGGLARGRCNQGCGCGKTGQATSTNGTTMIPVEQVTLRRRRSEEG